MPMHKALHPRVDVDRLYVHRKEGGRGIASIEDSVDTFIQRLEDYREKRERRLITAIRKNTDNTIENRMTKTRKQKWEGKQLQMWTMRWGDRDESINDIRSECSKLAQKEYNGRYVRVGKVIHWEMCKKF